MNTNLVFVYAISLVVTCCGARKPGDRAKSLWRDHDSVLRRIDSSIRSGGDINKMAVEAKKIGVEDVFRLNDAVVFVVATSGIAVSGTLETITSRSSNPPDLVGSIATEVRNGSEEIRMYERLADGWFISYTR